MELIYQCGEHKCELEAFYTDSASKLTEHFLTQHARRSERRAIFHQLADSNSADVPRLPDTFDLLPDGSRRYTEAADAIRSATTL